MNNAAHNRASDGITVNKVMAIITGTAVSISLGIVSYVYTTDRVEFKSSMRSISSNVGQLVVNEKISHARMINMDARIIKQEEKIERLYTESKIYWRQGRR